MLGYSNNPKANQETFDKVRQADCPHFIYNVFSSLLLLYMKSLVGHITSDLVEVLYSLCTRGAYYVPYSFLLISNKFCKGGERRE
jgi:hypothetical protein